MMWFPDLDMPRNLPLSLLSEGGKQAISSPGPTQNLSLFFFWLDRSDLVPSALSISSGSIMEP
jgi:hypothetical protein